MTLIEGTPAYSVWQRSEEPALLKIYFYDVLNPDEIVENTAKPYLIQRGPYAFMYVLFIWNPQFHKVFKKIFFLKGIFGKGGNREISRQFFNDLPWT